MWSSEVGRACSAGAVVLMAMTSLPRTSRAQGTGGPSTAPGSASASAPAPASATAPAPAPAPASAPAPAPASAPAPAPAPAPASAPASASAPPRPRPAAVWGGASLFALTYVASAFSATTGYTADDGTTSSRAAMWVPLVGPFVTLGSTRPAGEDALLVLDGLAQLGGLTLFVYGLTASTPAVVPRDASGRVTLSIAPRVDRRDTGASIVGTF
jgi:hypothetical protein